MFQRSSLRIRYFITSLLVIVPIIIFSVVIYLSTFNNNTQYINSSSLESFQYAGKNISTVFDRLDYSTKTAFNLESMLEVAPSGDITIPSEAKLCAALHSVEKSLYSEATLLYYTQNEKVIYTSSGKALYSDFERSQKQDYDLSMSSIFTKLLTQDTIILSPITSSTDCKQLGGLAYIVPFPADKSTKGRLLFLLSKEIISDMFDNHLGNFEGYLLIYDNFCNVLYERNTSSKNLPSLSSILKVRGTGVLQVSNDIGDYVMLHISDSSRGLHYVSMMDATDFYAKGIAFQRPIFILIMLLIIILLCMISLIAFYNYKPINELVTHVMGQGKRSKSENEIDLIKSRYDQACNETETLSIHLQELTPMVARTFINRLIFGRIASEEEFVYLSRCANISFSGRYNVALYVPIPMGGNHDSILDNVSLLARQFHIAMATIIIGELPSENALCLIVNFNCDDDMLLTIGDYYAKEFLKLLDANDISSVRIGVGMAYENALQISDSFAEACASAQFAPLNHTRVFSYRHTQLLEDGDQRKMPYHINIVALSLMMEGINRGKFSIAMRALNEILEEMSTSSISFIYFRFNCSQLISSLLKQAAKADIHVSKEQVNQLLAFNTQTEFSQNMSGFLNDICDEMNQHIQQTNTKLCNRLLTYILENYKQFEISIQMVSDDLDIKKSQIASVLKEATGQNFVQYVSYLRMNEFKRQLLETPKTIQDIVKDIGYSDVPNFLRKFKSIESITPTQYRALYQ